MSACRRQATGSTDRLKKMMKFHGSKYNYESLQKIGTELDLSAATVSSLTVLLLLLTKGLVWHLVQKLQGHVMSCCRAVVDDVGDHALPEPSVLWSPDELCWAYFVLQWITQAVQILQSLTSHCSPPVTTKFSRLCLLNTCPRKASCRWCIRFSIGHVTHTKRRHVR